MAQIGLKTRSFMDIQGISSRGPSTPKSGPTRTSQPFFSVATHSTQPLARVQSMGGASGGVAAHLGGFNQGGPSLGGSESWDALAPHLFETEPASSLQTLTETCAGKKECAVGWSLLRGKRTVITESDGSVMNVC